MNKSPIEWTEATWNPVTGCDKVSPGCTNCYAGRLAETRLKHLPAYVDGFFGNVKLHPDRLGDPLKLRKPKRIFVNSMSDLFHPDVPFEFIAQVFNTMASATLTCRGDHSKHETDECWDGEPHQFQILTKRPERMKEFFDNVHDIVGDWPGDATLSVAMEVGHWPLPNVWLGVSCEDQKRADGRIPPLLECPAAVRFVSLEPLLGPIDPSLLHYAGITNIDSLNGRSWVAPYEGGPCDKLDWVIVGGESGPKARPMHPDWVRSIRDQCVQAGTPFFFKQWGEFQEGSLSSVSKKRFAVLNDGRHCVFTKENCEALEPDLAKWNKADSTVMTRIQSANRKIDGREWNEMPGVESNV